jgi:hypothetical protein
VLDAPDGALVASATSNEDGIFEIPLDVGSYAICSARDATDVCSEFAIAPGERVHAEMTRSLYFYWSIEAPVCD